jgi:outer membrane receptor protein involved in Fe transport
VNANIGVTLPGDHLTVTAYGTNLGDEYYRNAAQIFAIGTSVQDAVRRQYGLRVDWQY